MDAHTVVRVPELLPRATSIRYEASRRRVTIITPDEEESFRECALPDLEAMIRKSGASFTRDGNTSTVTFTKEMAMSSQ